MKWIKHMARTARDERIAQLIGNGGMEGLARYGLYWRIQEIIAEQMDGPDPSCSVCYPVSVWSHLLVIRGSLVFSALSRLGVTGLVTVERQGSDIRVTNRKLLKYRDEYSRKSGQTQANVTPRTDQIKAERTDGLDHHMVASSVMDDLRMGGDPLRMALVDVCRRELEGGVDPNDLRRQLTDAWRNYQRAQPRLKFPVMAEKFFNQIWHSPSAWPWKEGEGPSTVVSQASPETDDRQVSTKPLPFRVFPRAANQ